MFHFRLQSVLDYRKMLEDKVMLEYAVVKKRLDDEKETLARLQNEVKDLVSQLRERGNRKLSATEVSFYLSYISHMRSEGGRQEEVVCRVGEELKEKRLRLVEAAGKRKIIEIIREKKLKEYKVALNDREQKELDETAILRSGRGVKSEEADNYL